MTSFFTILQFIAPKVEGISVHIATSLPTTTTEAPPFRGLFALPPEIHRFRANTPLKETDAAKAG